MRKITALIIFLIGVLNSFSQEDATVPNRITFFLECHDCDFTFVRQELDFVTFVRDPKLADVHILSTESRTGSGGRKYFMNFIGMNKLAGQNLEYEYISDQSETDDKTRKGLLKVIQTGILQYYTKNGLLNQVDVDLALAEFKASPSFADDPWNLWVFTVEAGSDFEKEASQNELAFNSEIEVDKITAAWKTNLEAGYNIDIENYFDDGERISVRQNEIEVRGNYIRSLSPRWSAGIFGGYSSQSYLNIRNMYNADAGIEYNIFPWDVSNRKVFTFRYQAGGRKYEYDEETIYNKTSEMLYFQALSLNLEMVQPWGNVETRLEGRHFFHDFSKNRVTLDSQISLRLTSQLSVYTGLEAEVVHDQLYLPKGDTSIEDLLLRRRKLATTYELSGYFGFRFRFGSIYNSVVNERF